ncbi:MAG TPA: hypothetical protein PKW33_00255 [Anaerolineaceae bacterium]|nr:hypothetical protein [Anaerolineaceae bacterium]HPN49988.1 hypothetical protein [Anaerolineaceae bacterium]
MATLGHVYPEPKWDFNRITTKMAENRGMIFLGIIFTALIAFEIFNYSTTDYALNDLLGEMDFWGLKWSTVLAIAFCGIDFAGVARLFTPQSQGRHAESWYLFGAWILAATMNALLTWWGVSLVTASHTMQSSMVMDAETLTLAVPIFVALMVWVIRILMIGSLSLAIDQYWANQVEAMQPAVQRPAQAVRPAAPQPTYTPTRQVTLPAAAPMSAAAASRPSMDETRSIRPTPVERPSRPAPFSRPEPTYQAVDGGSGEPRQFN